LFFFFVMVASLLRSYLHCTLQATDSLRRKGDEVTKRRSDMVLLGAS
jgi:hypothetical protein